MAGVLGGALQFPQITTPATPPAGQTKLYFKADGALYQLSPAGVETPVAGTPAGVVPIGGVTMYGGTAAPSGWLLCQGGTFLSTTYAQLATVLGDSFGVHSRTTYYLPDLKMRVPMGLSTGAGNAAFKTVGGTEGSVDDTLANAPLGREGRWQHTHQHDYSNATLVTNTTATGAANRMAGAGSTGSGGVGGAVTSNGAFHAFLTLNFIIRAT